MLNEVTTLSSNGLLIRKANPSDIPSIAELHRAAYGDTQGHLTARFSPPLLEEYYAALLGRNPYSYVALDVTEHPVGFVFAGLNTNTSVRSFVRTHKVALIKVLLLSPGTLALTVRRMLWREKVRSKVPLRLLSIAVEPSYQHRGTGKALLIYFEQELRNQGLYEYGLSVKANNIRAIQFYQRNGFKLEFRTPGANFYTKRLGAPYTPLPKVST